MKKVYYLIIVLLSFAAYTSADNKIKRPESYNYQRGLEAMQNEKFDEAIDYFKNGIVILVGDHHAWGSDGAKRNNSEPTFINKVPLIIIDCLMKISFNYQPIYYTPYSA